MTKIKELAVIAHIKQADGGVRILIAAGKRSIKWNRAALSQGGYDATAPDYIVDSDGEGHLSACQYPGKGVSEQEWRQIRQVAS